MEIKLESLNNDMFAPFKENEFSNLSKCVGGAVVTSTWTNSAGQSGTDTVENSTMDCDPKADIISKTENEPCLVG